MTPDDMRPLLRQAWSAGTSTLWRPENPALGQCGVTALLVQDLLGGEILKTRISDAWHFYNRIAGQRQDLTDSQFPAPIHYDDLPGSREEALADATPTQYAALRAAWHRVSPDASTEMPR